MPLSLADVLSAQAGGGPVYEGGPDANVTPGGVLAALGSTWPARMGQDIVQGAMAPGNAYRSTPENPVTTEQMVGPAANLAMLMVGAPGGSGGVGSGARSFSERMAEAQDIAFQRAQRGQATGDYRLGTAKRTAPEAAAGTPEYSSDHLMSSLRDTQAQLAEYKNPQKPLLAPGESPEDFALFSGGNKKAGAALAGIRAYHGSPYDFEKFDISKIGTGEGFQKYGHGLYFAENPEVAGAYKRDLVARNDAGRQHVQALLDRGEIDPETARKAFEAWGSPKGKMYEVNINAEPGQFLNWDAPLSEQPHLHEALKKYGADPSQELGQAFNTIGDYPKNVARDRLVSERLGSEGIPGIRYLDQGSRNVGTVSLESKYRAMADLEANGDISQRFFATRFKQNSGDLDATINQLKADLARHPNDATVKKTLDFASDPNTKFTFHDQPRTSNYVVFNPEIVDILKKYGLAGLTMGGVLTAAGQEPAPTQ